ncbi:hypothetical protein ENUP19_0149G0008 [Entamoeba nuttalli]|uniref:Uncharacterized protein n=1 Tax=Entamoeba nuttalli TaxID=412467 RepID=A0ABQ0DKZ1_9EUKA
MSFNTSFTHLIKCKTIYCQKTPLIVVRQYVRPSSLIEPTTNNLDQVENMFLDYEEDFVVVGTESVVNEDIHIERCSNKSSLCLNF